MWKLLTDYRDTMLKNDQFYSKRQEQFKLWFWTHLRENLLELFLSQPELKSKLDKLETEVLAGNMTPGQASDILTNDFTKIILK